MKRNYGVEMLDKEPKEKYRATGKVVLSLEIQCESTWGGDCLIDQVSRQAKEEALQMVNAALVGKKNVKVSGPEPKVTMISVERKDD